jgi:hypothetical protein
MSITRENLDEVFTFHKWTPEQIDRGTVIRAAAKELARAILDSAPQKLHDEGLTCAQLDLLLLAQKRRQCALEMVSDTVMKANAAITFEASCAGAETTW